MSSLLLRLRARLARHLGAAGSDPVETGGQVPVVVALWIIALLGGMGSQYLPLDIAPADARQLLVSALLLNIALTLLSSIRHRRLADEIRSRRSAEARVHTLASRDPLTSLANRRTLLELGAAMLGSASRRGLSVAVMTVNLDNFRGVNESRGHEAGDAILVGTAGILKAIVPPSATIARLGGDEFACILTYDAGRPATVDAVADAIVERLHRPFPIGRDPVHIGASVGIARAEPGDLAIDAGMRRADIALSAAKKAGGGAICWFDVDMGRELDARNAIESGLRSAIPAGQIVPFYEQQIDLETGRLEGFEVLARWHHPTDGIVPPDRFIPIAEEAGLISDLSLSVMRQAFTDASAWDPRLTLSVNISPVQLKDPWLAEKILKLLTETGFPSHRLEIEITETSLFENLPLAQSIVASLKNQGVRLALDDFGTGYSSLAHLRALPFDRIKIDKSFVITMTDDAESTAIVEAITRLGHSLSVPVTAEGVETAAIAASLRALGCHKVQGWHYGRPLDITQAHRLLSDLSLLGSARAA